MASQPHTEPRWRFFLSSPVGRAAERILALFAEAVGQPLLGRAIWCLGFAHSKGPAPKFGPVERGDGLLCVLAVGDGREGKAPLLARYAVGRVIEVKNLSKRGQEVEELLFGAIEWDISNVDIHGVVDRGLGPSGDNCRDRGLPNNMKRPQKKQTAGGNKDPNDDVDLRVGVQSSKTIRGLSLPFVPSGR